MNVLLKNNNYLVVYVLAYWVDMIVAITRYYSDKRDIMLSYCFLQLVS